MEKKDSAPPSRFPGASASPTDQSASQPSPSSPNSPRRADPSLQESLSFGEEGSPRNSEAPVKLRSLKDIYADSQRDALKVRIKVPPGYNVHSPTTAKRSGADSRGGSLKRRFKIPPGFHHSLRGPQPSDSSSGDQQTESSRPSLHYEEMVGNVLEDYLKQEIVNDGHKASLRAGASGPVGSQPGLSRPWQPNRLTGPDEGPSRTASGSSQKSMSAQALQSQEGRGGSDNPVVIGAPAGEPSQATPGRSAEKPGRWIERKALGGKVTVRIKLPESGSRPSDKPTNRECENE